MLSAISEPRPTSGSDASRGALTVYRLFALSGATAYVVGDIPSVTLSANTTALFVALFVIGLLDIGLSHGDTADVDTALLVAGLYLFGAPTVLILCTVSRVVVHLVASRGRPIGNLVDSLAKRYISILVCVPVLHLLEVFRFDSVVDKYVHVALLGIVFSLVQLVAGQVGRARARGDSILRLLAGNLALQGPLAAASVSVAVLIVVIIEDMGPWAIALTLILLLTMRQSFALLLDIRSAYQSTIEALVGAMEAQQAESGRGVGEEVASLARRLGAEMGWYGARLERIGYAALLHYFGLSLSSTSDDDRHEANGPLAEVEFLRPVAPLLAPLVGTELTRVKRKNLESAYVVALAVEDYSPGRDTEALSRLANSMSPARMAKVHSALRRVREKL